MSEINSWEDLRRKVIDEEFSDVPMQSRNTSEFEINVNARVWENIRTELLSKLRGGGIQFAIKHHDIHRDTGYYAYDEKGSDGKGIYTIDMPDGLEFSNFENPFDERDLFARVYSLFHEYKHILQREGSIYNIQITPENMAFGRAGLIAQYFTEYDEANYANDPREIDAQIYGIEQAIKYIKENYPWVDIEKACVGFVKDFINGQKENGFPELSFTEETSGSIQEILNDLRKRMENPRRAKFSEIVLHDWYDEDEPEKKLRNKFNDDFIKKYEDCKSVEEKDEMLITAILEIYPEAIQEYPILQMRSVFVK
ncbi:MAG: hypothetical protein J6A89_03835 [Clostridia bacterium]|nr:hypothetical protein [Clostridia bacterium]